MRDQTAWNKQKRFPSLSTSELPGKESGVSVPNGDTVSELKVTLSIS